MVGLAVGRPAAGRRYGRVPLAGARTERTDGRTPDADTHRPSRSGSVTRVSDGGGDVSE